MFCRFSWLHQNWLIQTLLLPRFHDLDVSSCRRPEFESVGSCGLIVVIVVS